MRNECSSPLKIKWVIPFLMGVILLTSCDSDLSGNSAERQAKPQAQEDMEDFDWAIYVKDTQKMKGPLKEPITIDLEAVNTSGDIAGTYNGSAVMSYGQDLGDVAAQVVSTSKGLTFEILPPLAPLGGSKDSEIQAEYRGSGKMAMATVSTARVDGQVRSRPFRETVLPITFLIKGAQVEMVVKYPMGTVTFNGYVIGEGKGTHKSGVKKPKELKPGPSEYKEDPEVNDDLAPLAPLEPLGDLAPLEPLGDETPPLAPLQPIEEPELAPLQPLTDEGVELAPLEPIK